MITMSWEDIIKNKKTLPRFIEVIEKNMGEFNEEDWHRPIIEHYVKRLKKEYDLYSYDVLRGLIKEDYPKVHREIYTRPKDMASRKFKHIRDRK
jgi:L-2-hydroxyglutarate oxidase LhgO